MISDAMLAGCFLATLISGLIVWVLLREYPAGRERNAVSDESNNRAFHFDRNCW